MKFKYIARDREGKTVTGILEEISNENAFKKIRGKQMIPLSLSEVNNSKVFSDNVKQFFIRFKLRIFIVSLGVGSLLIFYFFTHVFSSSHENNLIAEKNIQTLNSKSEKPNKLLDVIPKSPISIDNQTSSKRQANDETVPQNHIKEFKSSALEKLTKVRKSNPNVFKPGIIGKKNSKPCYFSRGEQLIGLLVATEPGMHMLDIHIGPDINKDILNSVTNVIQIFEDDTEQEASHKMMVIELKNEMVKLIKSGGDAAEVLEEYKQELNRLADYRDSLFKDMMKIWKEGTPEEAEEYVKKANEALSEYGAKPLKIPRFRKVTKD